MFLPAFFAVERVFITLKLSGATSLPTKLPPALTTPLKSLYLSMLFKPLSIEYVPSNPLPIVVERAAVFKAVPILAAVLNGAANNEAPPVIRDNAASSKKTELIIPAV